uniref:Uncharacterized protein n=1 Tax=Pristionchus pacificus TaxID=54126 RepID=A0A2A6B4P5_PRIPA|eukprot:PDM60831.1 hypothetical protein PRIPAC_54637 [Pristionchus pacificus]
MSRDDSVKKIDNPRATVPVMCCVSPPPTWMDSVSPTLLTAGVCSELLLASSDAAEASFMPPTPELQKDQR